MKGQLKYDEGKEFSVESLLKPSPQYLTTKGKLATERYKEFTIFRGNLTILQATKNATNQELSELIGLRTKRIEDFKLGRLHPKFDEIRIIAKYFGVTIDQLIYQKAIITFEPIVP